MVAMFEIVFLIACVVLGVWWIRRTNMYRARNSRVEPGQRDRSKDRYSQKVPTADGTEVAGRVFLSRNEGCGGLVLPPQRHEPTP